jgi:hypothetical protein
MFPVFSFEIELIPIKFLRDSCEIPVLQFLCVMSLLHPSLLPTTY